MKDDKKLYLGLVKTLNAIDSKENGAEVPWFVRHFKKCVLDIDVRPYGLHDKVTLKRVKEWVIPRLKAYPETDNEAHRIYCQGRVFVATKIKEFLDDYEKKEPTLEEDN